MSSAAAKYTRAREFCGFFSHRGEQLPAAIERLMVRSTTQRRGRVPRRHARRSSPQRRMWVRGLPRGVRRVPGGRTGAAHPDRRAGRHLQALREGRRRGHVRHLRRYRTWLRKRPRIFEVLKPDTLPSTSRRKTSLSRTSGNDVPGVHRASAEAVEGPPTPILA